MPVRKIPIGTRAVTGQHARSGARYESSLERDFFELMTHDPLFADVDWQPVTIAYVTSEGMSRHYTPDALVTFRPDPVTDFLRPPLLAEVKYREEYREKFRELRERFQMARQYAKDRGWHFKVVTDREIRTIAFSNRHFLAGFRDREPNPEHIAAIRAQLHDSPASHAKVLLSTISANLCIQAEIIPTMWWMVAHSQLHVDIFTPLSMETRISLSSWQ